MYIKIITAAAAAAVGIVVVFTQVTARMKT
jgi:hypothetical protein